VVILTSILKEDRLLGGFPLCDEGEIEHSNPLLDEIDGGEVGGGRKGLSAGLDS
jgi:hypothetical protein